MVEFTKSADKLLCLLYKTFLERRKSGMSSRMVKRFDSSFLESNDELSSWHRDDAVDALLELARMKYVKTFIGGDFDPEDPAIIFMENRFKNGLKDVVGFLSQFIP